MTKRAKKKPGWIAAAVGSAPDPRVNPESAEYGKRRVDRLVLVDDRKRAFELLPGQPLSRLPDPPDEE